MANTDKPMGFKPVGHLLTGTYNGQFNIYYLDATNSSDDIGLYDLVSLEATTGGDPLGLCKTVDRTAAGNEQIVGSVVGFADTYDALYNSSDLTYKYRPASTGMYVAVADDPFIIFKAQEDGDTTPIAVTAMELCYNVTETDCDSTTGISKSEIDSDSGDSYYSGQIRLIGIARDESVNAIGAYCKWLCTINEHIYKNNCVSGAEANT